METTELNIEGMTCNHCVLRVQKALEGVSGVAKAKVDLGNKNALVDFDRNSVNIDNLILAVKKAGYKAELKN
jgi:copper chaperone